MRISDWSSDVCSSDLTTLRAALSRCFHGVWLRDDAVHLPLFARRRFFHAGQPVAKRLGKGCLNDTCHFIDGTLTMNTYTRHRGQRAARSEEHTSELPSLMRISYAVLGLNKTTKQDPQHIPHHIYHITNHL